VPIKPTASLLLPLVRADTSLKEDWFRSQLSVEKEGICCPDEGIFLKKSGSESVLCNTALALSRTQALPPLS
jgi:hypothetical protein